MGEIVALRCCLDRYDGCWCYRRCCPSVRRFVWICVERTIDYRPDGSWSPAPAAALTDGAHAFFSPSPPSW